MKLLCSYCKHYWRVSRVWLYLKYLWNTKEIFSPDDYRKNIYYTSYRCPNCGNKIGFMMYMRRIRYFKLDEKIKK